MHATSQPLIKIPRQLSRDGSSCTIDHLLRWIGLMGQIGEWTSLPSSSRCDYFQNILYEWLKVALLSQRLCVSGNDWSEGEPADFNS